MSRYCFVSFFFVLLFLICLMYSTCNAQDDIRIVPQGSTTTRVWGRLEVYHNNEWGTVCKDSFSDTDANVACKQLKYPSGIELDASSTTNGGGRIWMDNLQCNGGETMLEACPRNAWGVENCDHGDDVGVVCDIDECRDRSNCLWGNCTNSQFSYSCACYLGWEGTKCDREINKCAPTNPCQNGGTCTSINGIVYVCTCTNLWTGTNCQTNVDECARDPDICNSGVCTNIPTGTYSCNCANTGFKGSNCQTDVDECTDLAPCKNGASCTNIAGSYRCSCKTGWKGENCDEGNTPTTDNITFVIAATMFGMAVVLISIVIAVACCVYLKRRKKRETEKMKASDGSKKGSYQNLAYRESGTAAPTGIGIPGYPAAQTTVITQDDTKMPGDLRDGGYTCIHPTNPNPNTETSSREIDESDPYIEVLSDNIETSPREVDETKPYIEILPDGIVIRNPE